ncbi:LADA_0H11936g1_1 [Lachancea dasiensis]|uniref:tRNA ligase n=1 Tax=Lachancea dasiensis TaxID=1072105 RepID=A0A1G4K3P7_9SACH|nr:LADA_0H11936g1_1 [Lachancea dasiensis]
MTTTNSKSGPPSHIASILRTISMNLNVNESCERLIADLEAASQLHKRGKAYKTLCQITNCDRTVVSWKFNEWDYGKSSIQLPVNARGLFILEDAKPPRIAARGYDKFFNVGEVPFTSWDWLSANTVGPYDVTVKENGCIIFVSGLEDGTLLICSKHSTGARDDTDRNHSIAGEKFLAKQLQEHNIDSRALGLELYDMNATVVAEYCDDTFEEHILEYSEDAAGLYVHGININSRKFETLPISDVTTFADKYGFKKVNYFTKHDIYSLRKFLEQSALVGSYENKEIEGFVIRTRLQDGSPFFFKFKFEEPYLMYRQWREATKRYIETKSRVFSFKKHRFITNKYLDFVIPLLDADEQLRDDYMKDLAIIRLRKLFLLDYGLSGLEILNSEKIKELERENAIDYNTVDSNTKFMFFPIATIGCGKTTTALTLQNLYPTQWGHVQNDDISGRDKAMLMKKSLDILAQDGVKAVIVDRNNHQFRERKQLFEWFAELKEKYMPYDCNVKIIALSFLPYEDVEETSKLTITRVLARGDRHQSIKAEKDGEKKVLGIMRGFINRYQPLDVNKEPDNLFDYVVTLRVLERDSSRSNVQTILHALKAKYPILVPEMPSQERITSAFEKSLQYEPTITKIIGGGNKSDTKGKKLKPIYFSAEIMDRRSFLQVIRDTSSQISTVGSSPISEAEEAGRVLRNLHITLCHWASCKKGTKGEKDIWCEFNKRYIKLLKQTSSHSEESPKHLKTKDKVKFRLTRLLWDDKIITATVNLLDDGIIDGDTGDAIPRLACTNEFPHVTLALLKSEVNPFYSNTLCKYMNEHHGLLQGTFEDGTGCLELKHGPEMTADICINL